MNHNQKEFMTSNKLVRGYKYNTGREGKRIVALKNSKYIIEIRNQARSASTEKGLICLLEVLLLDSEFE